MGRRSLNPGVSQPTSVSGRSRLEQRDELLGGEVDGEPEWTVGGRSVRRSRGDHQTAGPDCVIDDLAMFGKSERDSKRATHRNGDTDHQYQQLFDAGGTSRVVYGSERCLRRDVTDSFDRVHSSEIFDLGVPLSVDHHRGELRSVVVDR